MYQKRERERKRHILNILYNVYKKVSVIICNMHIYILCMYIYIYMHTPTIIYTFTYACMQENIRTGRLANMGWELLESNVQELYINNYPFNEFWYIHFFNSRYLRIPWNDTTYVSHSYLMLFVQPASHQQAFRASRFFAFSVPVAWHCCDNTGGCMLNLNCIYLLVFKWRLYV